MEETRVGEASSSQASGIRGHEEEHDDAEGFETASEGSRDDDDDGHFSDDSEVHAKDVRSTPHASDDDEMEQLEKELLQVGVAEDPPRTEEEEKQARLQAIAEANAAKAEGNSLYSQGAAAKAKGDSDADSKFIEALQAYDRGLSSCPLRDQEDSGVNEIRAILHANRAACYSNLQNNESAIKECTKALELNPNYVKALVRRYQAREKLTLYEEAIPDVKKVLELDPGNYEAKSALMRLVPLAEEKREKVKNEMIAKLKEAGNSILGRFGMSVDNFKAVQDPNTGSYSIQFQR